MTMSTIDPSQVIFETERLCIREFLMTDVNAVHAYASDLEVCRFQSWGPNTIRDTEIFLQESIQQQAQEPRKSATWAICLKKNGALIGGCSLFKSTDGLEAEIGFSLARTFWNSGYASECARALCEYAIHNQGIKVLVATTDARNFGSQKVLEKAGFIQMKIIKNHMQLRDGPRDTIFYQRLK